MTVAQIIAKNLKSDYMNYVCHSVGKENIEISYRLSIPAWINNTQVLKKANQHILYCGNNKKHISQYRVFLPDVLKPTPSNLTNNKMLVEHKTYKVVDLLQEEHIHLYLTHEREKMFRELRSNILLEKIGNLTAKWNAVSEGKTFYDEQDSKNYPKVKAISTVTEPF